MGEFSSIDNAVSLFAGIGGFDLALRNLGVTVKATCEIDRSARGVLAYHFPNVTHFGDVRTVAGGDLVGAGFDPRTGLICGGAPCQSFSAGGKQLGLHDPRGVGNLFWEMMRLADETKARAVLLENVPSLLTIDGGATFTAMVDTLREAGYTPDFNILDSQHFGVAQRRKRLYLMGVRGAVRAEFRAVEDSSSPSLNPAGTWGEGSARAERFHRMFSEAGSDVTVLQGVVGSVVARSEEWVDFDFPWVHTVSVLWKGQIDYVRKERGRLDENPPAGFHSWGAWLRSAEREHSTVVGVRNRLGEPGRVRDTSAGGGRDSGTFGGSGKTFTCTVEESPVVPFVKTVRSGQRRPDGSLPPDVWEYQETAPTQNLFDVGASRATTLVVEVEAGSEPLGEGSLVRTLTPVEVERLQGFPDGWTRFRVRNHVTEGSAGGGVLAEQEQSAGVRCRQLGNAVTVPVVEWVVGKLLEACEGYGTLPDPKNLCDVRHI